MQNFRPFARFSKGLRVDESGVRGALMEAHQVIPVRRGAGFKTRGAKRRQSLEQDDRVVGLFGWPVELPNFKGGMFFTFDSASGGRNRFVPYWGQALSIGMPLASTGLPIGPRDSANAYLGIWTSDGFPTAFSTNGSACVFGAEALFPAYDPLKAGGQDGLPTRWGGKETTTGYRTGSIAGTAGSTVVTGTGTTFTGNVRVGDYLWLDDGGLTPAWGERWMRVLEVRNATTLIVDAPHPATFAGAGYRVDALGVWTVKPGTFGLPTRTANVTRDSLFMGREVTQHKGRVWTLGTYELNNRWYPDRLRWSAADLEVSAGWKGADYWHPNAFTDVAPGTGGDGRGALVSIGTTLFIIKERAVFALRGDVETDGRDVGAAVSLFSDEDGLFGGQPVLVPGGALFCGRQGLWLLTESGMRNITDQAGLRTLWEQMFGVDISAQEERPGMVAALSLLHDRVVVHRNRSRANMSDTLEPNALVWYMTEDLWVTQNVPLTTRAVPIRSNPSVVGGGTRGEMSAMQKLDAGAAGEGRLMDWEDDHRTGFSSLLEADEPVLMTLATHAISVAEKGGMNGRLRAAQVKSDLVEDGQMQVQVLMGEQHEPFEAVLVGDLVLGPSFPTERWYRVAVRGGTPPVDQVELRLQQLDVMSKCVVFEAGVEVVGVRRVR